MKSVQGFNYLYRRNSTCYFRFVMRKYRTKFQIMFSLHTKNLNEAIAQWQMMSDLTVTAITMKSDKSQLFGDLISH